MDHWQVSPALDGTARTFRVPPLGPRDIPPPLERILQRHRTLRPHKDRSTGNEQSRIGSGEIFGLGRILGDRAITRRRHKARELLVGHLGFIHPKSVHGHPMNRIRIREPIPQPRTHGLTRPEARAQGNGRVRSWAAHRKLAAANPHHTDRSHLQHHGVGCRSRSGSHRVRILPTAPPHPKGRQRESDRKQGSKRALSKVWGLHGLERAGFRFTDATGPHRPKPTTPYPPGCRSTTWGRPQPGLAPALWPRRSPSDLS